jgi:hypothetical protein
MLFSALKHDIHYSKVYSTLDVPGAQSLSSLMMTKNLNVDRPNLLGLSNGSIYDVPDVSDAIGDMEVNATYFNVTCQFFNDANITSGRGGLQKLVLKETERILAPAPLPHFVSGSLFSGLSKIHAHDYLVSNSIVISHWYTLTGQFVSYLLLSLLSVQFRQPAPQFRQPQ